MKKKQIRVEWWKLICVSCSTSSQEDCWLEACPSGCATKAAVEKIKDDIAQPKAKAKPILPIATKPLERETDKKRCVAKEGDGYIDSDAKNLFPKGHLGLCPHCMKSADMSAFDMDSQKRIWCNKPGCKRRATVWRWICVKCSDEANLRKPSGKSLNISSSSGACTNTLISSQYLRSNLSLNA